MQGERRGYGAGREDVPVIVLKIIGGALVFIGVCAAIGWGFARWTGRNDEWSNPR